MRWARPVTAEGDIVSTREQFGNYLLLKKLAEDPLGETFRAGLLGAKGMERVALLRVMNGQGIDGQRLWAASHERAPIQKSLRSPNIGDGIEIGAVHGIPYVAYDYVSGKNLAMLFEQATKQRNPISTDHALLISERLALALSVAAEHRHEGQRILHGFLVPHMVMISNEGDTKLLGFEFAIGLRSFVGNPVLRRHFGRYLAPEALAGAAPEKSDDIYSLGVILYELLTGHALPPQSGEGYGELIDRATLATEDRPLPTALAQLLKQSLVPAASRMRDVSEWHKTLAGWMSQGDYNPTTFNLAFYMHNLYRQDIERESQEIEVEKTLPLPTGAATVPVQTATATGAFAATAPPASATPGSDPVTGTYSTTGTASGVESAAAAGVPAAGLPVAGAAVSHDHDRGASGSSKTPLWLALAAVLLLGLGAVYWFVLRDAGNGQDAASLAANAATAVPGNGADAMPTTTPEEDALAAAEAEAEAQAEAQAALQAQIDGLVAEKASDMESQLRTQMDQQLDRLRNQLQDAQKAAAEREKQLEAQRKQEAARKTAEQEAARLAAEEAARKAAEEEAVRKVAEEEAARKVAEEEAAARKAVVKEPPKPTVRRGDLVEPGVGVTPPKMVRFPTPRFPEMARRLNRTDVTVPVRVLVDENGKVIDAQLESDKKAGFGFDAEALTVARGAEYSPATADGVPVKMWMTLNVRFR